MVKKNETPEEELESSPTAPDFVSPEPETPKVELAPEQLASRQLAHDVKVAKFLAGGEF